MQYIVDSISVLFDFIWNTISSVVELVRMLPDLYNALFSSFAYAPDFVMPFLTLSGCLTLLFAVIRLIT